MASLPGGEMTSYLVVKNMKISAVRSLADICFLHVLFGILIVLFN